MVASSQVSKFVDFVTDIIPKYRIGVEGARLLDYTILKKVSLVADKSSLLQSLKEDLTKTISDDDLKITAQAFLEFKIHNQKAIKEGQCKNIFDKLEDCARTILEIKKKATDQKVLGSIAASDSKAEPTTVVAAEPAVARSLADATPLDANKKAVAPELSTPGTHPAAAEAKSTADPAPESYEDQFKAWAAKVEAFAREIEARYATEKSKTITQAQLDKALIDAKAELTASLRASLTKEITATHEADKKKLADEATQEQDRLKRLLVDANKGVEEKIATAVKQDQAKQLQIHTAAQQAALTTQKKQHDDELKKRATAATTEAAKYSDLDTRFKALDAAHRATESELKRTAQQLRTVQSERDKSDKAAALAATTLEKSSARVLEVGAINTELKQANQKLLVELKKLQDEAQAKYTETFNRNAKLQSQLKPLHEAKATLEAELTRVETTNSSLQTLNASLQKRLASTENALLVETAARKAVEAAKIALATNAETARKEHLNQGMINVKLLLAYNALKTKLGEADSKADPAATLASLKALATTQSVVAKEATFASLSRLLAACEPSPTTAAEAPPRAHMGTGTVLLTTPPTSALGANSVFAKSNAGKTAAAPQHIAVDVAELTHTGVTSGSGAGPGSARAIPHAPKLGNPSRALF